MARPGGCRGRDNPPIIENFSSLSVFKNNEQMMLKILLTEKSDDARIIDETYHFEKICSVINHKYF